MSRPALIMWHLTMGVVAFMGALGAFVMYVSIPEGNALAALVLAGAAMFGDAGGIALVWLAGRPGVRAGRARRLLIASAVLGAAAPVVAAPFWHFAMRALLLTN